MQHRNKLDFHNSPLMGWWRSTYITSGRLVRWNRKVLKVTAHLWQEIVKVLLLMASMIRHTLWCPSSSVLPFSLNIRLLWASCHLKSAAILLFVQADNKETSSSALLAFVRESIGDRRIPLTKGHSAVPVICGHGVRHFSCHQWQPQQWIQLASLAGHHWAAASHNWITSH